MATSSSMGSTFPSTLSSLHAAADPPPPPPACPLACPMRAPCLPHAQCVKDYAEESGANDSDVKSLRLDFHSTSLRIACVQQLPPPTRAQWWSVLDHIDVRTPACSTPTPNGSADGIFNLCCVCPPLRRTF